MVCSLAAGAVGCCWVITPPSVRLLPPNRHPQLKCVHGAGDSLCYAFIGFDTDKASEDAYFKMNNVLIDDRRIKARWELGVECRFRVLGTPR